MMKKFTEEQLKELRVNSKEEIINASLKLPEDYVNVLNKVVKLSGMDCWCVVYNNHVEDIEEGVVFTLEEAIPDILEGVTVLYKGYPLTEEEVLILLDLSRVYGVDIDK